MYKLQSIIFNKQYFSLKESMEWILQNGYSLFGKVDETKHFYRFRQNNPKMLKKQGFNKVVTKDIHNGVKFILFYNE